MPLSPGEGKGYPLQYSCLRDIMDRGAWQAAVHGVAKSQAQLNDFHFHVSKSRYWGFVLCQGIWGSLLPTFFLKFLLSEALFSLISKLGITDPTWRSGVCVCLCVCVCVYVCVGVCVCGCACVHALSHVQLFVTLWIVASQAPLSVGFSQQEYWSGLPFPRGLHDPGIEPTSASPALAGRFSTIEPPGKPREVC